MPDPLHKGAEPETTESAKAGSRVHVRVHVRVQTQDFSLESEVKALHAGNTAAGAVCSFVGLVRAPDAQQGQAQPESAQGSGAHPNEAPKVLWLEHYPGMTESSIEAIGESALKRFGALAARVVHRIGPLKLGEQIVLVAVLAAHRQAAFAACEYLLDHLKTEAPFWKKEWRNGKASWVQAKDSDEQATARWHGDGA